MSIYKLSNFLNTFIVLYHLTIIFLLCILVLCLLITRGKPSLFVFDKSLFHYQRQPFSFSYSTISARIGYRIFTKSVIRGKDATMLQLSTGVGYSYSRMKSHAERYLHQCAQECPSFKGHHERLAHIRREIDHTGTYWQSSDELTYGAKLAWRNSTRCIGR